MNYQKIHDAIIGRAMNRTYVKGIHHNHHIIPLHEDANSTQVVPLTIKEHGIVHLCRHRMTGTIGNYTAGWLLLGFSVETCSLAGKLGGKTTKENKTGIFSDGWDRSLETTKRWAEGTINKSQFNEFVHCSTAGKVTKENKLGIFSDDWDRSENNRRVWNSLTEEQRYDRVEKNKTNASLGGQRSVELGTNFSAWDKEKQKEVASAGARACLAKGPVWTNGKINKRSHVSPGEGWRLGVTHKRKLFNGEK
jgi:hypothetical protein